MEKWCCGISVILQATNGNSQSSDEKCGLLSIRVDQIPRILIFNKVIMLPFHTRNENSLKWCKICRSGKIPRIPSGFITKLNNLFIGCNFHTTFFSSNGTQAQTKFEKIYILFGFRSTLLFRLKRPIPHLNPPTKNAEARGLSILNVVNLVNVVHFNQLKSG